MGSGIVQLDRAEPIRDGRKRLLVVSPRRIKLKLTADKKIVIFRIGNNASACQYLYLVPPDNCFFVKNASLEVFNSRLASVTAQVRNLYR